eukprot:m.115731 g.115731  ORF g.115731 m.115731 type:complete len:69 (-) comp9173_c0_seq5:712-918(-)
MRAAAKNDEHVPVRGCWSFDTAFKERLRTQESSHAHTESSHAHSGSSHAHSENSYAPLSHIMADVTDK